MKNDATEFLQELDKDKNGHLDLEVSPQSVDAHDVGSQIARRSSRSSIRQTQMTSKGMTALRKMMRWERTTPRTRIWATMMSKRNKCHVLHDPMMFYEYATIVNS